MSDLPRLTRPRFVAAPPEQQADGLVGWFSATVDGVLAIDSIALRRSRTGMLDIEFPCRVDRGGRAHAIVRPVDTETRRAIRAAAIRAAHAQGALS